MKFLRIFLGILAISILASGSVLAQTNKINNGGFEYVNRSVLEDWAVSDVSFVLWAANHSYKLYAQVRPNPANGYFYMAVVAGTSGASQPTFPTAVGETLVDGGVTWKCMGSSSPSIMSDNAIYHSGTKSLRITGPGYGRIYQDISITPGKKYRISLHLKENSADSQPWDSNPKSTFYGWITIKNSVSGNRYVLSFTDYGVRNIDWVSFYLGDIVAVANDTTLRIDLQLRAGDDSSVWFDDVVVYEEINPDPVTPKTLFNSEANYKLWSAHQQADVLPTDTGPVGSFGTRLSVSAVRGERQSFQMVVLPATDWTNVTWTWGDFTGPGTIAAANMVVNRVAYVTLPAALPENGNFMRAGKSPDPLPLELSSNLTARQANPFFFTINVPQGIVGGVYQTKLTLVNNGVNLITIPISLTVADCSLPVEPIFDNWAGIFPRQIPNLTYIGGVPVLPKSYIQNVSAHRAFTAYANYKASLSGPPYTITLDTNSYNFNELTKYGSSLPGFTKPMSTWSDLGLNYTVDTPEFRGKYNTWGGSLSIFTDEAWETLSPDFITAFKSHISALMAVYVANDCNNSFRIPISDELPNNGKIQNFKKYICNLINSMKLGIQIHGDGWPNPEDPKYYQRWWIPGSLLPYWNDVVADFRQRQSVGVYNNVFLTRGESTPPIKWRLFPWALWQDGYSGCFWWSINYYAGKDPWSGQFGGPVLIYPPRAGIDRNDDPINSTRWEALRQGCQDCDLFYTLQSLIATRSSTATSTDLSIAQTALGRIAEVVTHAPIAAQNIWGTQYDQFCTFDLSLVEEVRQQIVDAIVLLEKYPPNPAPPNPAPPKPGNSKEKKILVKN
jgi:hypothetical protein